MDAVFLHSKDNQATVRWQNIFEAEVQTLRKRYPAFMAC